MNDDERANLLNNLNDVAGLINGILNQSNFRLLPAHHAMLSKAAGYVCTSTMGAKSPDEAMELAYSLLVGIFLYGAENAHFYEEHLHGS